MASSIAKVVNVIVSTGSRAARNLPRALANRIAHGERGMLSGTCCSDGLQLSVVLGEVN